MILVLLFLGATFLAYSNGANDNFKGVATLFGSGTTTYKSAIRWATITTFMGSIAAIFLAGMLVKNFSGKGLVPDELLQGPEFAIAVALGAAITVFIATKVGMPVSTTHGLVGALFGTGVVAIGSSFNFAKLGSTFIVPLLVSPLMAAVLSLVAYFIFSKLRAKLGFTKETCVCVGKEFVPVSQLATNGNTMQAVATRNNATVRIDKQENCIDVYQGSFLGINMQRVLDAAHFFSAGVVSFARGLNDTPKIAGLLLVIHAYDIKWGIGAIAVAIAVGGLLNARKVGITMSKKITGMNHGQGFTANLITGLLVTTASIHGLPVSTTHVSVGSIFGIGTVTRKVNYRVVSNILLSWVLTLPVAALVAGAIYWVLTTFVV
ncbi:anion permease [Pontibacter sp. E15-1]|uniref:inorganic phosphate transporter n=1 Tax=Pontibacter sp. E15-1 TaxID=2919918 RepID=UPI001F5007C2|nr:inorganic phosphate transporter [Pontibacter sp. E15-1]MCJ8167443.1 anion permease [Pontibacter sp. E15-1]